MDFSNLINLLPALKDASLEIKKMLPLITEYEKTVKEDGKELFYMLKPVNGEIYFYILSAKIQEQPPALTELKEITRIELLRKLDEII